MAQPIVIKVSLDAADVKRGASQVEREVRSAVDGGVRQAEAGGRRIGNALSSGFARAFSVAAITTGLAAVGSAAIQAARDLDKSRQTIAALTGSVEAANVKLGELRKLAQSAPGVTTGLAASLFAQFRAIGGIADTTINNLIKSIGRLNAAFTLPDPDQFARNITQIYQQGFERADIKEALTQVPIFEQILESAFGTKDPEKLRKLKEAGQLTLDGFVGGIADAVAQDSRFATIQESIGVQIDKLRESILNALAPLGDELSGALVKALAGVNDALQGSAIALRDFAREVRALVSDISSALQAFKIPTSFRDEIRDLEGIVAIIRDIVTFGQAGAVRQFRQRRATEQQTQFGGPSLALSPDSIALLDVFFGQAGAPAATSRFGTEGGGGGGGAPAATSRFGTEGGGGGGGGSSATSTAAARNKALRDRKAFLDAVNSLELQRLRQAEDIAKRNRDLQLETLKEQYDQSLISTNEFYAQKLAIAERNIQAEINLLQVEATQLEAARDVAKGAEKIKIEEQLVKLYGEQQIKVLGLTALLRQNFEEYKKAIGTLDPNLNLSQQEQAQGEFVTEQQRRARQALEDAARAKQAFQERDIQLAIEEQRIQNAINAGVLTEAEGRESMLAVQRAARDEMIAYLELQKQVATGFEADRIQLQIEQLRNLGLELSGTQRFIKGLGSETETLGDIFERFGQNVSRSFNSIKDVFNNLKNAVKQFFADILGNSLRNLLRGTLGFLFGGGSGGNTAGGGGGGGFLGNLLGGALGTSFSRASGIASAGGGGALNFFGGGGGSPITGGLNSFLTGGFAGGNPAADILRGPAANTAGGGFGGGGLINSILGKVLGVNPAGGFLASAGPVLAGIGLGAGLGGQSVLGQILGGIGGAAVGLGVSFGASVFGAGGGLAAAGLAALGPAALIGAPLLIGAFLLGRAKQRGRDEEQSGVWLTEAIAGIQQIKAGVQAGSIAPDQARSIFENNVLATFIQQINTLKTKSVRESRLTNQVRDLRNLFDKEVGPAIDAARKATVVNRNIIPEFHTGGLASNETLAVLQKGEMVLTAAHQNRINAMVPGVFEAVGVPNAPNQGQFHAGGRVNSGFGGSSDSVNVQVTVVMGRQDQTEILVNSLGTDAGKKALARSILRSRMDREI